MLTCSIKQTLRFIHFVYQRNKCKVKLEGCIVLNEHESRCRLRQGLGWAQGNTCCI